MRKELLFLPFNTTWPTKVQPLRQQGAFLSLSQPNCSFGYARSLREQDRAPSFLGLFQRNLFTDRDFFPGNLRQSGLKPGYQEQKTAETRPTPELNSKGSDMLGKRHYRNVAIDLFQGDITEFVCDAMVNAANPQLAGGGGVDGAIHRVGGSSILAETREKYPTGCPVGEAVTTSAGNLPAKWVIHTVGPIWQGEDADESHLLRAAYQSSLREAKQLGARHIAFPSVSTGTYRYPLSEAAYVAMTTVKDFIEGNDNAKLKRITFVLYNMEHYRIYQKNLYEIFPDDGNQV